MPVWLRSRASYIALALATIVVGLVAHRGRFLPPAARDIAGDALWAMMVTWWTGAIAPRAPLAKRAVSALAFAFAIEVSQMYHAPWIDTLRRTSIAHLVLGSDFDARDLAAYAAGVLAAALLEFALRRRPSQLFRP